jgi:hypothetical protein
VSADRPYTVEAAAAHLACSPANIRNLCRTGKLRHFRVGCTERGPIRIPADAMAEFERCASAPQPAVEPAADQAERVWGARLARLS